MYSTIQRQSMISTTCAAWALLFLYQMCYNVINKQKKNFLSVKLIKRSNELVSNEAKLLQITFRIFTNFNSLHRKKCRNNKRGNQICCNFISLVNKK